MVATREAQFAADEFEAAIADQRAGEQAGFGQDLEAVADAEHEPAIGGELLDGLHDGREFGDRPAAQVVAIGEASGEDDGIDIAQGGGVVPDKLGGLPEVVGDRVKCIVIAIASGKNNDAKFHGFDFRGGGSFHFTRGGGTACVRRGHAGGLRGTGRVTEGVGRGGKRRGERFQPTK